MDRHWPDRQEQQKKSRGYDGGSDRRESLFGACTGERQPIHRPGHPALRLYRFVA